MKRFLVFVLVLVLFAGFLPANTQANYDFPIEKEAILSALYEADISAMREAIDLGLVTCEELTAYYLDRISAYNKPYNCFITICEDALEVARKRDITLAEGKASGILFGIPIVIKDNIDLAGYHTTNGHKKADNQIASENATIVDYLIEQGAVIIAKTNMSTDAQSARDSKSVVAGRTHNAYNKYLSASGSSGGSAVATSLNFAAAALSTDTNSSLRMPAAYAGCISLRFTFGQVSSTGITPLNTSRDVPGAITRSVYDQAILADAITNDQFKFTENLDKDALKGLRIGVMKELSYAVSKPADRAQKNIDAEVSAAFANALTEFELCGATIVEVSMPDIFKLYEATTKTNDSAPKEKLYKAFLDMLAEQNVSAVVFPSYLSTPLYAGTDSNGKYWSVWDQTWINNCGVLSPSASLPEITVPIGLHSLGCGIGLEIAAPKNQEQLLLDIAYSYTDKYDHRELPSGAPDTYASSNVGSLRQIVDAFKYQQAQQTTTVPLVTTTLPVTTTTAEPITTTVLPQTETVYSETTNVPIITPQSSITTMTEPAPLQTSPNSATDTQTPKYNNRVIYIIIGVIACSVIFILIIIRSKKGDKI